MSTSSSTTAPRDYVPATIRDQDMTTAMAMLTANYSRVFEAVLREIATNAHDAHVAAGINSTTTPVEIILPSSTTPRLVIADQGTGMSLVTITDVIGNYVASLSRDNDAVVGTHGIGAKAPFAVSTRYVVDSVTLNADGKRERSVVEFTLIDDIPHHRVVDYHILDEASVRTTGTIVTIDLDELTNEDLTRWVKAAREVFYWWPKDTVRVSRGAQAVPLVSYVDHIDYSNSTDDVLSLDYQRTTSHGITFVPANQYPKVLMGVGAYDLPSTIVSRINPSSRLVFVQPVKSLAVTPNRETIIDDDTSLGAITDAFEQWAEFIAGNYRATEDKPTIIKLGTYNQSPSRIRNFHPHPTHHHYAMIPLHTDKGLIYESSAVRRAPLDAIHLNMLWTATTLDQPAPSTLKLFNADMLTPKLMEVLPSWHKHHGYNVVVIKPEVFEQPHATHVMRTFFGPDYDITDTSVFPWITEEDILTTLPPRKVTTAQKHNVDEIAYVVIGERDNDHHDQPHTRINNYGIRHLNQRGYCTESDLAYMQQTVTVDLLAAQLAQAREQGLDYTVVSSTRKALLQAHYTRNTLAPVMVLFAHRHNLDDLSSALGVEITPIDEFEDNYLDNLYASIPDEQLEAIANTTLLAGETYFSLRYIDTVATLLRDRRDELSDDEIALLVMLRDQRTHRQHIKQLGIDSSIYAQLQKNNPVKADRRLRALPLTCELVVDNAKPSPTLLLTVLRSDLTQ